MNPGSIVLFDGDADKRRVEWELENRLAPEGDPERPPRMLPKTVGSGTAYWEG